jgi:hypothetical protein
MGEYAFGFIFGARGIRYKTIKSASLIWRASEEDAVSGVATVALPNRRHPARFQGD